MDLVREETNHLKERLIARQWFKLVSAYHSRSRPLREPRWECTTGGISTVFSQRHIFLPSPCQLPITWCNSTPCHPSNTISPPSPHQIRAITQFFHIQVSQAFTPGLVACAIRLRNDKNEQLSHIELDRQTFSFTRRSP